MNDSPSLIAGAVVMVIASIVTGVVTIINALAAVQDRRENKIVRAQLNTKADTAATQATRIETQNSEIHAMVNGAKTIADNKLAGLEAKIMALHAQLEQLQERRVEDAKTRAAGDGR